MSYVHWSSVYIIFLLKKKKVLHSFPKWDNNHMSVGSSVDHKYPQGQEGKFLHFSFGGNLLNLSQSRYLQHLTSVAEVHHLQNLPSLGIESSH